MNPIPEWLVVSILVAIGLIIIAVPIRVLTKMTRGSRDRTRKVQELADRMKERFGGVSLERSMLGPPRIGFTIAPAFIIGFMGRLLPTWNLRPELNGSPLGSLSTRENTCLGPTDSRT